MYKYVINNFAADFFLYKFQLIILLKLLSFCLIFVNKKFLLVSKLLKRLFI